MAIAPSGEAPGRWPRRSGIGRRITALVVAAVLLSVCLASAIFLWSAARGGIESRRAALEATAYVFAAAIADEVESGNAEEALRVLRSISRLPDISYAAVTDAKGKAIASLGSVVLVDGGTFKADTGVLAALTTSSFPIAVDIIRAGRPVGRLVLVADVSNLRHQLLITLLSTLLAAFVAGGAGLVLANGLQRRITAPILALTETMRRVRDTRDYTASVQPGSDDETGVMVEAFNSMITEINLRDKALERQRQTLEATVVERTRELRVAKDAAVAANQAKSAFLATMSHEIRTPMNGLMVMAELLAAAELEPRHRRYAEVIAKSGHSLLTIINDILDLSKIEAGKLVLERVPVNPAAIADDVTSLFWEQAMSKGIDLAARVAANVPKFVEGDPVRLNQILCNLVNNALKFTETGHVMISLRFDGMKLSMAVTDSGIGIHQHQLNNLFEAFTQADQATTRRFGGTGLGLTICRRLSQAMGGTISVRSDLGKGSTFTVAIPVEVVEPAARSGLKPLGKGRAAIACEGPATLSALGTALVAGGYAVEAVTAGPCDHDVVFATTDRLAGLSFVAPRPPVICLAGLGDRLGEQAVEQGLAQDLMVLPLRQSDIAEMLERLSANQLRGASLLERRAPTGRPAASFAGRTVLVADDSAVNREVIIEVLRQLDVNVEVAVNGREAVEIWQQTRPDLVFMDCSMPEMDGYAAAREIRAHEKIMISGGHTPIIALTANVAGAAAETWKSAGMDAYLTKPFTLKSIVTCLEDRLAALPPVETATAPAGNEPVIDADVIDELKRIDGNDALFRRVLDLFASRVPQAVDKVAEAVDSGDREALADAVHALKSMCANIGARRATALCDEFELAVRSGADLDVGEWVGGIAREMRSILTEIEHLRVA